MQLCILGTVEVRDGDRQVPVAGARLARLLLRLAVDVGRDVPARELADEVWGEDPPADVSGALQTLVSRLRRTLRDGSLVQQGPGGYRLTVPTESVDAFRFSELARRGHEQLAASAPGEAAATLREALALWRGPRPLNGTDADELPAGGRSTVSVRFGRWEEQRLEACADRIDAELRLGAGAELVGELEELATEHPLRERFTAQLMSALAASGRPAEALATYERTRRHLADQLGADPSPALQDLHVRLLRGEDVGSLAPSEPVAGRVTTTPRATAGASGDGMPTGGLGPATGAERGSEDGPRARHARTNLRSGVTSFVGRDDDVKRVDGLLRRGRLATIVGPGGAGKTRLSVEVGAEWVDRVRDGVWFVPLAPVTDEADIGTTILGSLGVRENHLLERRPDRLARDAMERLLDVLVDSDALLVLDNCEHLVEGAAEVVDRLLAECPDLRVLTTSREPLGVDGEALWGLSSLPLPAEGADPRAALASPAVQLLAERGAAARADFRVESTTVGAAVEIVRRLDGLPLAIELAAARLRVLPVEQVAARLSDRFALLTGGRRTALPRHRTLRAVVQWSWDLLTDAERLLAERLSVFPAGAGPAAVAAVCADGRLPMASLPDLLNSLVDKSLLQVAADGADGVRYRMLETIREFGTERLVERGEVDAVRQSHARHFSTLVHEADARLRTRDQLPWLALLGRERDNVLAALRHLGDVGDVDAALGLALDLTWYWSLLGSHGEAAGWMRHLLALPGAAELPRAPVAEAVLLMNSLAEEDRELVPPGDSSAEHLVTRWRAVNARLDEVDVAQEPLLLVLRPVMAFFAGDWDRVESYFQQALRVGDPWIRSAVRAFRGNLAENSGQVEQMREHLDVAMEGFSEIGERWGMATTLGSRAHVRTLDGDLAGALEDYERASAYMAELGAPQDSDMLRLRKLAVLVRMGEVERAEREARELRAEAENRSAAEQLIAEISLAGIAQSAGDKEEMRRLRRRVPELLEQHRRWNPLMGHAHAILLAVVASGEVEDGLLEDAAGHLRLAHHAAVDTKDMPVVSNVAVSIAEYLLAQGDPEGAAELLGAAAVLRGSDDLTDVAMGRLRTRLREALEGGFDPAYRRGRALGREQALARLAAAIPG